MGKLGSSFKHTAALLAGAAALVLNPMFACSSNHDSDNEPAWEYEGEDMAAVAVGTYVGVAHFDSGDVPFTLTLEWVSFETGAQSLGVRTLCGSHQRTLVKLASACDDLWESVLPLGGRLSSEGGAPWNDVMVSGEFRAMGPTLNNGSLSVELDEGTLSVVMFEGKFAPEGMLVGKDGSNTLLTFQDVPGELAQQ